MADYKVTSLDPDLDFSRLDYWDVVIVGAGPAGLAASLTTAHRGLTTLVIEAKDAPLDRVPRLCSQGNENLQRRDPGRQQKRQQSPGLASLIESSSRLKPHGLASRRS